MYKVISYSDSLFSSTFNLYLPYLVTEMIMRISSSEWENVIMAAAVFVFQSASLVVP